MSAEIRSLLSVFRRDDKQQLDSRIQPLLLDLEAARDIRDRHSLVVEHSYDGPILVGKLAEALVNACSAIAT